MSKDPVNYDTESSGLCSMDMTVGFSDTEFTKIDALRSNLNLSWKELLTKIHMAFSDGGLKENDLDKINSTKRELNLSSAELFKNVCLIELMMMKKE